MQIFSIIFSPIFFNVSRIYTYMLIYVPIPLQMNTTILP